MVGGIVVVVDVDVVVVDGSGIGKVAGVVVALGAGAVIVGFVGEVPGAASRELMCLTALSFR